MLYFIIQTYWPFITPSWHLIVCYIEIQLRSTLRMVSVVGQFKTMKWWLYTLLRKTGNTISLVWVMLVMLESQTWQRDIYLQFFKHLVFPTNTHFRWNVYTSGNWCHHQNVSTFNLIHTSSLYNCIYVYKQKLFFCFLLNLELN